MKFDIGIIYYFQCVLFIFCVFKLRYLQIYSPIYFLIGQAGRPELFLAQINILLFILN